MRAPTLRYAYSIASRLSAVESAKFCMGHESMRNWAASPPSPLSAFQGAPGVRSAVLGAALCRCLHALASKETQLRVIPRGPLALRNQQVAGSIPVVGSTKSSTWLPISFRPASAGSGPEADSPCNAAVRRWIDPGRVDDWSAGNALTIEHTAALHRRKLPLHGDGLRVHHVLGPGVPWVLFLLARGSTPHQADAAAGSGNQCRVRLQTAHTESITGTSTSTPTTVASAAPEPGP